MRTEGRRARERTQFFAFELTWDMTYRVLAGPAWPGSAIPTSDQSEPLVAAASAFSASGFRKGVPARASRNAREPIRELLYS